jgi:hypothetical protein
LGFTHKDFLSPQVRWRLENTNYRVIRNEALNLALILPVSPPLAKANWQNGKNVYWHISCPLKNRAGNGGFL